MVSFWSLMCYLSYPFFPFALDESSESSLTSKTEAPQKHDTKSFSQQTYKEGIKMCWHCLCVCVIICFCFSSVCSSKQSHCLSYGIKHATFISVIQSTYIQETMSYNPIYLSLYFSHCICNGTMLNFHHIIILRTVLRVIYIIRWQHLISWFQKMYV